MTPRDCGLRLAPAWSEPGRFWMAWPQATGDKDHDEAAREDTLGLAELLSEYAPVTLVCPFRDVAEASLRSPPGVAAFGADHDGSPLRDHAPLWLVDAHGALAAAVVHSPLSRAMAEIAQVPLLEAPAGLPLMIESDGEGCCLLPECDSKDDAARLLQFWLGMDKLVWLTPPPAGPVLGVRFLAPGLVAVTVEADERHANFSQRATNRDIVADIVDGRGRLLRVVELPSAKRKEGSYADCLLAGERVVVPEFEDGRGGDAFALVSAALPHRKVAAFPSSWIAPHGAGLGAAVAVQPA